MGGAPVGTTCHLAVPQVPIAFPAGAGAAALLMGCAAIRPELDIGIAQQLTVWRTATLGRGGLVSPLGLAIAARRMLVQAKVTAQPLTLPLHGTIAAGGTSGQIATHRHLCADHLVTARELAIPLYEGVVGIEEVEGVLVLDGLPLVLTSHSLIAEAPADEPAWVVVAGTDGETVLVRDPWASLGSPPVRPDRQRFASLLGSKGDSALVALYPLPTTP